MQNILIPDEIKQFILSHIPTVACMEAILLMRSNENLQWSLEELSKRLFINDTKTRKLLKQLHNAEIIKKINKKNLYQYYPKSRELKNIIDKTATLLTWSSKSLQPS